MMYMYITRQCNILMQCHAIRFVVRKHNHLVSKNSFSSKKYLEMLGMYKMLQMYKMRDVAITIAQYNTKQKAGLFLTFLGIFWYR